MTKPDITDSSLNEFNQFYSEIESFYKGKILTDHERKTIIDLKRLIKQSAKDNLDAVDLSRAESQIAVLLMTLGELATERMKQTNLIFRYNKWKKHKEWNAAKGRLESEMAKVLVGDIENEVNAKMFADLSLESYLEGIADYLVTLHKDGHVYLNSLKDRIKASTLDWQTKQ